jgi:hypothetical protein
VCPTPTFKIGGWSLAIPNCLHLSMNRYMQLFAQIRLILCIFPWKRNAQCITIQIIIKTTYSLKSNVHIQYCINHM